MTTRQMAIDTRAHYHANF